MNGAIVETVKNAPKLPGVYKMYNNSDKIIYIGKAKNLRQRLYSYTKTNDLTPKTLVLVKAIAKIEFEITKTEADALILEASLIKSHQPKYNILLKDDKSRLYIKINKGKNYPAISRYRGKFDNKSHLFGPFGYVQGSSLSTHDVIKNLTLFVNKVFGVRSCKDSKFASHKTMGKPCMEYQIKTCSGPCAGMISQEDYLKSVNDAVHFLNGNYSNIELEIKKKIKKFADEERFSEAGALKSQILAIEKLKNASNEINFTIYNNVDIIVIDELTLQKIEVFSIRNGYAVGGNIFEIQNIKQNAEYLISSFLFQHYSKENLPPKKILVSNLEDIDIHKKALQELFGINIEISCPKKGDGKRVVDFALENLSKQNKKEDDLRSVFKNGMALVKKQLNLESVPKRIEVYDNSHMAGNFFLGVFIVATEDGFAPKLYRKFNAQKTKDGDDYGMMREVMLRRFTGSLTKKDDMPNLLLIDGGIGQFNVVSSTLKEIGIEIPVCAIAKGRHRNSGNETFFTKEQPNGFKVSDKQTLLFLERIRDEAHRFAITSHRKKRGW